MEREDHPTSGRNESVLGEGHVLARDEEHEPTLEEAREDIVVDREVGTVGVHLSTDAARGLARRVLDDEDESILFGCRQTSHAEKMPRGGE
jgi:hypothetical protein